MLRAAPIYGPHFIFHSYLHHRGMCAFSAYISYPSSIHPSTPYTTYYRYTHLAHHGIIKIDIEPNTTEKMGTFFRLQMGAIVCLFFLTPTVHSVFYSLPITLIHSVVVVVGRILDQLLGHCARECSCLLLLFNAGDSEEVLRAYMHHTTDDQPTEDVTLFVY